MSKHTPGPWTVTEHWDGTSIQAGQFHVTHTIQSCGFHEPEMDKAVTQANALLIAAAPDMLETLKRLREMCADFGANTACEVASAAIDKATGETK